MVQTIPRIRLAENKSDESQSTQRNRTKMLMKITAQGAGLKVL